MGLLKKAFTQFAQLRFIIKTQQLEIDCMCYCYIQICARTTHFCEYTQILIKQLKHQIKLM